MYINCSTTFSLIGSNYYNISSNLFCPDIILFCEMKYNKGFFSVGNNLGSLLNSFYLISSIITSFTIWDKKKLLGVTCEFYSHLLLN